MSVGKTSFEHETCASTTAIVESVFENITTVFILFCQDSSYQKQFVCDVIQIIASCCSDFVKDFD